MVEIPVTLLAVTTRDYEQTRIAIEKTLARIRPLKLCVFTDRVKCFPILQDGLRVETIPIGSFGVHENVSIFGMHTMAEHAGTFLGSHVLVIHYDGYVVNEKAWDSRFLNYDIIGAPWGDKVVCNTGFWMVSVRMLKHLLTMGIQPTIEDCHPHDQRLCRDSYFGKRCYRRELEDAGFRYAPYDLAERFSVERANYWIDGVEHPPDESRRYDGQFGFHGHPMLNDILAMGL